MSGVQIGRVRVDADISGDTETRTWRTKAMSLRPGGPVEVPSRYVLDLGHTLSLSFADEAAVRLLRDTCDQLLALPAPEEVGSVLPTLADGEGG